MVKINLSSKVTPVAVIVPCANPAVEPEVHALLPAGYFPYVARLPFYDQYDLKQRLAKYITDLPNTLETLQGIKPAGVLIACTGSSYPLGLSGDTQWTTSASDQIHVPVVSAAGSVAEVLKKLNRNKLVIISPYPKWLTEELVEFWSIAGYEITDLVELDKTGTIYDLSETELAKALSEVQRKYDLDQNTVILIAGTGVPSLNVVDQAVAKSDLPIVTSQIAGVWNLLRVIGATNQLPNSASAGLRKLTTQLTEAV